MIDLDKESNDFEFWAKSEDMDCTKVYFTGQIKAEDKYGKNIEFLYNEPEIGLAWDSWQKRAELAKQEIAQLKAKLAKLAKYESNDVVVVPRVPTQEMIKLGENNHSCIELGSDDVGYIYKAMIEAGEIK